MLVLLNNFLNCLKDSIFKCFFKEYKRIYFFKKELFFSQHIMIERLSLEEEKIIKDIRNFFRLGKENKAIKYRILRAIRNFFEHEKEENYYKPVRASNFWSNNYIEYGSDDDRNKILSVEEYLNKIKPYLIKDIINNLKKLCTWKIQLTIANNFISSIDNDEEHVMHSKSDNVEIMINDEADEVVNELSESIKNRYQNNLESIKGSKFIFDFVHLLYYQCHKTNLHCDRLYI